MLVSSFHNSPACPEGREAAARSSDADADRCCTDGDVEHSLSSLTDQVPKFTDGSLFRRPDQKRHNRAEEQK